MKKRSLSELEIKSILGYEYLADGHTLRTLCPACHGGRGNEKSLSIYRNEAGVFYKCWRDSCSMVGFFPLHHRPQPASGYITRKEKPPRVFTNQTEELSNEQIDFFFSNFGLNFSDLLYNGVVYSPDDERVVFPCYSVFGKRQGEVLRSYTGAKPKALNYGNPPYSYYPSTRGEGDRRFVVLVEDCVSAIKMAHFAPSMALLGTNLRWEAARDLRRITDTLIIRLDPGAEQSAINLKSRWLPFFQGGIYVILQDQDPKDTPDAALKRELKL